MIREVSDYAVVKRLRVERSESVRGDQAKQIGR